MGPVCNQKREKESFFFFFLVGRERLQHQDSEGDSKSQLAMKEEPHLTFFHHNPFSLFSLSPSPLSLFKTLSSS